MKSPRSTVYIVDDDASVRTSLERLLQIEKYHVRAFSSVEEFLKLENYKRPACLLLDIRMPGLTGLDLQDICEKRGIQISIVFVTGYGEVPTSVLAMKKGAVDFLTKPYKKEVLLQAVHMALERNRQLLEQDHIVSRAQDCLHTLTQREREVLQGVVAGRLNKQIALELGITEQTVKIHRGNVMMKTQSASVPGLVRFAQTAGVITDLIKPKYN